MDVDEQRIRWALEFREVNLKTTPLVALRARLLKFFDRPERVVPLVSPLPQDFSMDDFSRLKHDVRTVFDHLFAKDVTLLPFRFHAALMQYPPSFGSQLHMQGPTRDCVLWLLYSAIMKKPAGTIRRCPEDACGHRPFYRYRRQTFCSTTCTTRAMQRAWRKKHRTKEAERQRKKYERKVKRIMEGFKVRITKKGGTR
jgi:hypothetical protein